MESTTQHGTTSRKVSLVSRRTCKDDLDKSSQTDEVGKVRRSGNAEPLPPDVCNRCRTSPSTGSERGLCGKLFPCDPGLPSGQTPHEDCWKPKLPRKEVIQPHLPVRLPCYDFVPVARPTLGRCLHLSAVGPRTSGVPDSHDVTGGVYKARVRIHRALLTRGY